MKSPAPFWKLKGFEPAPGGPFAELLAAHRQDPDDLELTAALAYAYLRRGAYEEARQFDKAMAQWQMVLDLESDHPQRMKLLNLLEKYRSMKHP